MTNKRRARKIWDSKLLWAIISLVVSLALWSYVTSTEGTIGTRTLSGVKVEFSGESALRDTKGLIVTDVDTNAVTITVSGPSSVLSKLDASSVKAVIDLSSVTGASTYIWSYDISYPSGINVSDLQVTSRYPQNISITVDKLSSKSVEVCGSFDGSLAEDHKAEPLEFSPATVKVYGPEAVLAQIDRAWVSFERDDVDTTLTLEVPYTLLDQDGNLVDTSELELETETVTVTLPIQAIKEVPLTVNLIEGAGATDKNSIVNIEPSTITISGDSAILDGINKIVLATIDLTSFTSHFEDTLSIPLDNEVENMTGIREAEVTIDISGLSTKKLYVTNFSCINVTEGYSATILTQSREVTVRAAPEVLQTISSSNLRGVADMTDYGTTTGTVTPTIEVYVDGNKNAGVIGTYEIDVKLARK